jgi:hypothetical protein
MSKVPSSKILTANARLHKLELRLAILTKECREIPPTLAHEIRVARLMMVAK